MCRKTGAKHRRPTNHYGLAQRLYAGLRDAVVTNGRAYWPKTHSCQVPKESASILRMDEADDHATADADDNSTAADSEMSEVNPIIYIGYEDDEEDVVEDKVVSDVVDETIEDKADDEVVFVDTIVGRNVIVDKSAGDRRVIDLTLADDLYVDLTMVDETFVDLTKDEDDDAGPVTALA